MAPRRVPIKDQLFTREKIELITGEIERLHSAFRADEFFGAIVARFPELELKARIDWIATCLQEHLPPNFRRGVGVLVGSLPAPVDPTRSDGDFGDFVYAPQRRVRRPARLHRRGPRVLAIRAPQDHHAVLRQVRDSALPAPFP